MGQITILPYTPKTGYKRKYINLGIPMHSFLDYVNRDSRKINYKSVPTPILVGSHPEDENISLLYDFVRGVVQVVNI